VAVMRNPEFRVSSFASVGYPDNSALEEWVRILIVLPTAGALTNLRTGETAQGDSYETYLDPWSAVILKRAADPAARQNSGRPAPPGRRR